MSKTLRAIAQELSSPKVVKKSVTKETKSIPPKEVEETKPIPKVQLIYAFNGTGKTRLSMEFKELIDPKGAAGEASTDEKPRILYYNAFTEDLFYWDNDLVGDAKRKLKIQPNSYTAWVLKEQGQDQNAIAHFQRYTHDKLTPRFNEEYKIKNDGEAETTVEAFSEVTFSFERGNEAPTEKDIKISKGEEHIFIWSIFYSLIKQVIDVLNEESDNRDDHYFDNLEYVFVDDPVSSLDENHLIELAVDLAGLIKASQSDLRFIISTHNPLFYNVLHNELNKKTCYLLGRSEDGGFLLVEKDGDSNQSFSYHLHLKQTLERAIADNQVQKYHFNLLRNLYEKTANFLGYSKWSELLPDEKQTYYNRIIQFTNHSTLSNENVAEPTDPEKRIVKFLLKHLLDNYGYCKKDLLP